MILALMDPSNAAVSMDSVVLVDRFFTYKVEDGGRSSLWVVTPAKQ